MEKYDYLEKLINNTIQEMRGDIKEIKDIVTHIRDNEIPHLKKEIKDSSDKLDQRITQLEKWQWKVTAKIAIIGGILWLAMQVALKLWK